MSKLIVNTGTLSSGGAERVLSIMSTPFANSFDEVQYVMWLDAKYPEIFYKIDPRVRIIRVSVESDSSSIWHQILWFRKYIISEKPDIVLSFMVMVCFTVTASLLFTGIKQVVAERNDPRYFKNKILRRIINYSYLSSDVKGILMQTEWNKSFFKNRKLLEKTTVIYNPVNIESKYIGAALYAAKKDLVVSVGRLTRQKQQSVLLQAFAIFHKTHPSYQLVIYGEGEERENLTLLAAELGINDSFILAGRSNEIMKVLLSAKAFVISSEYEGMSNALLEAMCVGLPCISTKVSGATDLINDGKNGFLVEVGDYNRIAKVLTLLATDDQLREQISKESIQVYELLNHNIICQQWVDYLKTK